ncbi:MAG: ATP-binding protein [Clostridia bacterium]|nr:ATP-binding protein [Clostridia bacterium]
MINFDLVIEIGISLFDAVLLVYFISRFNNAPLSPRQNKFIIPTVLIILGFSVINDLFLAGFNLLGTFIFLFLYILYALFVANGRYVRALFSACIFEVVFVLLSSLLYLVITFIIKDYEQISQGSNGIFRYTYLVIHKIAFFVALKIILMVFNQERSFETKHGIIAFLFSFATVFGLGATMYIASVSDMEKIQLQTIILTVVLTFSNVALYILIYQMQKYQQNKYELRLLQEKIAFEEARHNDAAAIWSNIRKVQHDMKQHITVISGYIEENKIESCKEYLNELLPKAGNIGNLIASDNKALDYLINSKLAPLKDTKIVISGSIGDLSDIREFDLVCLIGNILDNAIEALEKISDPKDKRIELLFVRQNSNRIIICKNSVSSSVLTTNKELKTTKKSKDAHGYGTKIVAKIVSDYHGIVDYFEDFNMFGVQIILPDASNHIE